MSCSPEGFQFLKAYNKKYRRLLRPWHPSMRFRIPALPSLGKVHQVVKKPAATCVQPPPLRRGMEKRANCYSNRKAREVRRLEAKSTDGEGNGSVSKPSLDPMETMTR